MLSYRGSDEESEDGDDTQLRPQWAVEPYLSQQLLAQRALDPDEIFQQHANTCSLDEVFSNLGTGSRPCYDGGESKMSSSKFVRVA